MEFFDGGKHFDIKTMHFQETPKPFENAKIVIYDKHYLSCHHEPTPQVLTGRHATPCKLMLPSTRDYTCQNDFSDS